MKRKIYDVLLEWKKDGAGKTALLIDGARRVGKSYIVEEFAKAEYKTYLMIDFNRVNDEVKDLFNNYLNDLDSLFMRCRCIQGRELRLNILWQMGGMIILKQVHSCLLKRMCRIF